MLGEPTASVANGSTTIVAISARLATITGVSIAVNAAIMRWCASQ